MAEKTIISDHELSKWSQELTIEDVTAPSVEFKPSLKLTEDQDEAFTQMKAFVESSDKFYVLQGYAGCGKTTLVKEFMDYFLKECKPTLDSVVLAAPTHKALKVMRSMMATLDRVSYLAFSTIHSLLGIQPYIDHDGKEVFSKNDNVEVDFSGLRLILVDEASMVDDELFKYLYKYAMESEVKVIFVGDPKQIPPVNHTHSMPLHPKMQEKLNFVKGELTTIVRQASDNPIITLATSIREAEVFSFKARVDSAHDDIGIYHFDISTQKKELYKKLNSVFNTETFAENTDHAKVIAWTNKTVTHFNNAIRALIYGRDAPKIMAEEKLLMRRPILVEQTVLANNNEDLVINSATEAVMTIKSKEIKYYYCTATNERGDNLTAKIVHEDSEKEFDKILVELTEFAKKQQGKARSIAWKEYYRVYDTFVYADYNYAITAHRSQGSTYDKAFVIYTDIMNNPRTEERNRILYTAVTRPRNELYII